MAVDDTPNQTQNPNSIYFLNNHDVSLSELVNSMFDGVGFNDWKRSNTISLSAGNKFCCRWIIDKTCNKSNNLMYGTETMIW